MAADTTRQETLVNQALWLIESMRSGFAVVLMANVFAAITDVIGISLMLPAIQLVSLKDKAPSGLTAYFAKAFDVVGIDFTFSAILIVMVAVFLFKFVLVSTAGIVQSWLLVCMRKSFRARIVKDMASADWAYVAGQNLSRFINLYVGEVDGVIAATKILVNFLSSFVFVAVFLCASFAASWRMTLLTVAMASILFFPLSIVSRISKRLSTRLTAKNLSSYHFFAMMLSALKYLKATETINSIANLAEREIRLRGQTAFRLNIITVVSGAATEPIVVIFVCSFALVATLAFAQQPSDIILPLLFLYRTSSRVLRMQRTGISFSKGAGSVGALRSGLLEIAEAARPREGADPGPLSGAITLDFSRLSR